MGAHRQCVGDEYLAVFVHNLCFGHLGSVFRFDDYLIFKTGLLVDVDTIVYAFHKVVVHYLAALFAHDYSVEGVPFADYIAGLYYVAVVEIELRTVGDGGVGDHHLSLGIDDSHFCESTYNYLYVATVSCLFFSGNSAEFFDFECTVVTRSHCRYRCDVRSHTTDVECTQSQLSTGLAD